MSRNRETKTFKHYIEFPSEVRSMIIDEMEPDDRCRFTRCSSLSQKEGRKSKNYIHGLTFIPYNSEDLTIFVIFSKKFKFSLQYKKYGGIKYIEYKSRGYQFWSVRLNKNTDIVQMALENFKNILHFYQNTIKTLAIIGTRSYDFEIQSLKNLERLELGCVKNIQQFISKLRKPLKEFEYKGDINTEILEIHDYIYHVEDCFDSPNIKLNYDQFLRFSAKKIKIHIGDLTPNNIYNFIKSWQRGEVRESFKYCCWDLRNSKFNEQELWRLLREPYNGYRMQFAHNYIVGKRAELCYSIRSARKLIFEVMDDNLL